tara:strand:+ start:1995 stop:2609 length:615 start_codon:yes stop_codon:yes gene_type:complete
MQSKTIIGNTGVKEWNIIYEKSMKIQKYKPGLEIKVDDKMQTGYKYTLTARYGMEFDEDFNPELKPDEMLKLGIFEGKYMNDCKNEFPEEWYKEANKAGALSPKKANPLVNAFKVKSRMSLQEWERRGWIPITKGDKDIRGWFQWYCRYYIGRRDPNVDRIQIKRWKSYKRHVGQIKKNCKQGDIECRPKQRQGLLQWAYNPCI